MIKQSKITQMHIDMLASAAAHNINIVMDIYMFATLFGDKDTSDYIATHYYSKLTPVQQQLMDMIREELAAAEAAAREAYEFAETAAHDAISRAAWH